MMYHQLYRIPNIRDVEMWEKVHLSISEIYMASPCSVQVTVTQGCVQKTPLETAMLSGKASWRRWHLDWQAG